MFDALGAPPNPRLAILRREVEQTVGKPLRTHGWAATIEREIDGIDCIEITAAKRDVKVNIAILYSNAISNADFHALASRVTRIFFQGQPYMLESYARGISIPVEPLGDFFPFLVKLNKQVEPDRSPSTMPRKPATTRRLTAENPLEAVLTRLQQFTSVRLAARVVERRATTEGLTLAPEIIASKATGIAYSMRSALDYVSAPSTDRLNKRVLGLYYGTMAFAQAEMLASPLGPIDLDEVEGMTKQGHGLWTLAGPSDTFADFRVGVLASGFLPQWLSFLGYDTSGFPKKKPRSVGDLGAMPQGMVCSLRDLLASMPEIHDLFAEVCGGPPGWVIPVHDSRTNWISTTNSTGKKADSTYGLFIDRSGLMTVDALQNAGWPLAEIERITEGEGAGVTFRARVDHAGHDLWWDVLPTHSSPFGHKTTLILPTVGGIREYRVIAATTLYALSIMARYLPSAWRRIEGGDEDHYFAMVRAAVDVWARVLPEEFLQSIADEAVHTTQPGSIFSKGFGGFSSCPARVKKR